MKEYQLVSNEVRVGFFKEKSEAMKALNYHEGYVVEVRKCQKNK